MKKKLLPAAVFLAAFAGAATAQTNVTIYGVTDIGIERTDDDDSGATWSLASGIQSGSRIGFRGTEDLGGGLSAIFTLENGFNLDVGTAAQGNRLFGRQAWVGLKGGFGTVKFGRQDTPLHRALDAVDPFGTGLAGDIESVFTANGVFDGVVGADDTRMNNTINYSVGFGGFNAEVALGLGEVAGSTAAGRQFGGTVGYKGGPVTGIVGYHDTNSGDGGGDGRVGFVGGVYDFQVAKLHAAFAANKSREAGETTGRSRDYMVGVSAPLGAGTVMASYIRHDDRTGSGEVDANKWAVGYVHALSKRTNLYTSYGRIDFKTDSEADGNAFNVGIRHRF